MTLSLEILDALETFGNDPVIIAAFTIAVNLVSAGHDLPSRDELMAMAHNALAADQKGA